MLFTEKIKELRILNQMPQRQLAAALEIDTATYCKIEKGERKAKAEQIEILSKIFNVEYKELENLWLADKVYNVVGESKHAKDILHIVNDNIAKYE